MKDKLDLLYDAITTGGPPPVVRIVDRGQVTVTWPEGHLYLGIIRAATLTWDGAEWAWPKGDAAYG